MKFKTDILIKTVILGMYGWFLYSLTGVFLRQCVSQRIVIQPNKTMIEHTELQKEYPSLTLMVRAYHASIDEITNWLFPSFQLFWPIKGLNVSWVIVLDEESEQDRENAWKLSTSFPYPKIEYEALPDNGNIFHGNFKTKGYDRQQYSNFFCDRYTDSEVIGIMDSDSTFITAVTPESMFEDGKPVVIGAGHDNFAYPDYSASTEEALGIKPIGHFMNNFPVLAKRQVFPDLRKHIEAVHGKDFDRVFSEITAKHKLYCQFDWIINFMWHFRNTEYSWHIHFNQSGEIQDFNKTLRVEKNDSMVTIQNVNVPKSRVATHLSKEVMRKRVKTLLIEGICHSSKYSMPECEQYNGTDHLDIMRFEYEPIWYPVREALDRHYLVDVVRYEYMFKRINQSLG